MTTKTTAARARRAATLSIEQVAALRAAYAHLFDCPSVTDSLAQQLREAFPAVLAPDAGPLFGEPALLEPTVLLNRDLSDYAARYVDFMDRHTLPEHHPRVQAWCAVSVAPSRPPIMVAGDRQWELDCLWERWRYRIGEVPYSRWAKDVKPALQVHGFLALWNAIEALREGLAASPRVTNRLGVWLDSLTRYVHEGQMAYRNAFGDLTTRGRRVFGGGDESSEARGR